MPGRIGPKEVSVPRPSLAGTLVALALALGLAFAPRPAAAQTVQPDPGATPPPAYTPVTAAPVPTVCPAGSAVRYDQLGPPGCYQVSEVTGQNHALFWPGFGVFLASYLFTVGYGAFEYTNQLGDDGLDSFGASLIPVLGPFIAIGFEDEHREDRIFLGVVGVLQVAGMTMMILSHVFPRRVERIGPRVAFTGNGVWGTF